MSSSLLISSCEIVMQADSMTWQIRRFSAAIYILGALLIGGSSAHAADTGTITGRIVLEGDLPQRQQIMAHHDSGVCGAQTPMLDDSLVVSASAGVANAALVLSGVRASRSAPPTDVQLTQRNCTFMPHVQTVTVGSTLNISNEDPTLHNVHALRNGRTVFNLAMPLRGVVVKRSLKRVGVISVRCDSGHTWMSTYIVVAPHSFHATSNTDGSFVIRNVPAGTYTLRIWHERLGSKQVDVAVAAGDEATVNVSFKMPDTPSDTPAVATAPSLTSELVDIKLGEMEEALRAEIKKTKTGIAEIDRRLKAEERRRIAVAARPLYLRHCAPCHGRTGNGIGPAAKFLEIPPRDFRRGEYEFRMTPSGTPARVEDIYRTITAGILGTPMPSWQKVLTDQQRLLIARYLMTLSELFSEDVDPDDIEPPIEIGEEPPHDAASVKRGAELYKNMKCAACHGDSGRGDGPSADTTKDDWGHPIQPYDLTLSYYQGGRGGAVVYRAFSTGLSGTPMPSYGDTLEPEQRWDLVHYVLSIGEPGGIIQYLFGDAAGRISPP